MIERFVFTTTLGKLGIFVVSFFLVMAVLSNLLLFSNLVDTKATYNFGHYIEKRNKITKNASAFLSCSGQDTDSDGYVTCTAIDSNGVELNYLCPYSYSPFASNSCVADKKGTLNINK